jgi:hypothetical protein
LNAGCVLPATLYGQAADLMPNGDTWAETASVEFITEPFFLF